MPQRRQHALTTIFASLIAVTLAGNPPKAHAFVERPNQPAERFTLPWVILCSGISVLEVERVDLEKGAILYKRVEQLQGPAGPGGPQQVKHRVPRDERITAALGKLKPGQLAVHFAWDFGTHLSVTYIEGTWYTAVVSQADRSWQQIDQLRPDLNCCFAGSAGQLAAAIKILRASREVVIPCWKSKEGPEMQTVRCTMRRPMQKALVLAEDAARHPLDLAQRNPEPREIVPALIEALTDPDPTMRVAAAGFLGRLGRDAKEAIPALKRSAAEKDARIRNAASAALKKIAAL